MNMKKKLVVLTGAGISAESGFRTFRDSDGLWNEYRVEDVCTPEGFMRNPKMVLDFYNQLRKDLYKAKPNYGHIGLKELEDKFDVKIITQNVDNLHERAGSKSVLHLHGELMKVCSVRDVDRTQTLTEENCEIHVGDKGADGAQLRPYIVWFGEAVPNMEPAVELASEADVFLIVGTSLNVYPAASLINYVPLTVPVYIIDPKQVSVHTGHHITTIKKNASEGMKEFIKLSETF